MPGSDECLTSRVSASLIDASFRQKPGFKRRNKSQKGQEHGYARVYRPTGQPADPSSAGPAPGRRLPGLVGGADASNRNRGLDLHLEGRAPYRRKVELG